MESGTFTGKFLKPSEAFSVQHFNHVDLNRLAPEILVGLVVAAVVGLVAHFVVSMLKKKGAK